MQEESKKHPMEILVEKLDEERKANPHTLYGVCLLKIAERLRIGDLQTAKNIYEEECRILNNYPKIKGMIEKELFKEAS